ncbi:MAG: ATP-binding protein, partial [Planctomycetota bacterium]
KMVTWEAAPNTLDFYFVHGSCVELLGFSETEWLKPGFWQHRLHTEDAMSVVESLKQAALGNQRLEYRMLHKDGHEVWIETIVEPVRDEASGEFTALRGVLSDITVRKRLEDKLRHSQKMEAVGRLAGGVAHDFNNLLTVINAYAELLRLDMENEEARQSLKAIQDAANRASNLTAQLLMFARTSVNNVQVISVNSAVKSSEPLLRRLLGRETTFDVSLQHGLPNIKADTSHLDQVLVNLTVNARDAMPEGGSFRIETSRFDSTATESRPGDLAPGEYVAIAVSDTGVGMSEETRAMAFEPFYTTKPVGQGTGLGLAVVYGVIRDCGGTISVSSTVGEGTTITIFFPATEDAPSPSPKEVPNESSGSELILLVEDEESVRRAASATLRRHGYEVLEANGAQQALSLANDVHGNIALLLTDMAMPGTNGLELANTIRSDYPNVRVLCMSGYSHDIFQRRDSAHAFLQKPFTGRGLVSKVREVLDET